VPGHWSVRKIVFVVVSVAFIAALAFRWQVLSSANRNLAAEVTQLEREWKIAAKYSQDAAALKPWFDQVLDRSRRISQEANAGRWTSALQAILESNEPGVEVLDFRASGDAKQTCLLEIEGASSGSMPRTAADGFRKRLQTALESKFPGAVTTRFDALEDQGEPTAAERKAVFRLSATVAREPASPGKETLGK
jgi:hypothetical protein